MKPGTPFVVEVNPRIPRRLSRLSELADNLWYAWDRPTRTLFARLHPGLWDAVNHNPKAFLKRVDEERLTEAAEDHIFLGSYNRVLSAFDTYMSEPLRRDMPLELKPGDLIAYFCAEFGYHESFPVYSGGLGILAGDHCKSASDLRLPFVAVGLLYRQGYFSQRIDNDGNQIATYTDSEFDDLPMHPALNEEGKEIHIHIELPGRRVEVKVWEARIGHVQLYACSTPSWPSNSAEPTAHIALPALRRRQAAPASSRRSCSASAAPVRWRRWASSLRSGTSTKATPPSWCSSASANWSAATACPSPRHWKRQRPTPYSPPTPPSRPATTISPRT
jgi:starch phosphorylase